MGKYVTYVHPAVPPVGIKVGEWYLLDELLKRFSLDYIKGFFTPANFGWEEISDVQ